SRPVPFGQSAVLLEPEEAPAKLEHALAHPAIADPRQPLLAPRAAALVRGAGQPAIAPHRPLVAKVAHEHLMGEPVGRLEAKADPAVHLANHRMTFLVGRLAQPLLPARLDLPDLLDDEAQPRQVAL